MTMVIGNSQHGFIIAVLVHAHTNAMAQRILCRRLSNAYVSLGMGKETAEVYRWKGVENANIYYQGGRGQYDLLAGVLRLQWDRKACDDAITAVDATADAGLLAHSTWAHAVAHAVAARVVA